jgi:hypothetical protein
VAGRVAGTYLPGLFDNPEFTRRFLSIIERDRKLLWQPEFRDFDKDHEYDRLAAGARAPGHQPDLRDAGINVLDDV